MPLPAYMTAQPKIDPTLVLNRQIRSLGLDVELTRHGQTLTIRDLELNGQNLSQVKRAISLLVLYADLNQINLDAIVYTVQGNVISNFLEAGFLIHMQPMDDEERGAHTLLHRGMRN